MLRSLIRWKVNHPGALGHRTKAAIFAGLRVTSPIRTLPDFVIIGAQKCGTTSLYNYLALHPHVLPSIRKATGFFAGNSHRSVGWYRANFPTVLSREAQRLIRGGPILVGEATTMAIVFPHSAMRFAQLLPGAKSILLLRNPVQRTISHYHHNCKRGLETLSLEGALDEECQHLEAERQRWSASARDRAIPWTPPERTYLFHSLYADQVENWLRHIPRQQLLVLQTESLASDSAGTLQRALEFLGLPGWHPPEYRKFNTGSYDAPPDHVRERLESFFAPHNERLAQLLGDDFRWG